MKEKGREKEDGRKVVEYGRLDGFRLSVLLFSLWRCLPRHDRATTVGTIRQCRSILSKVLSSDRGLGLKPRTETSVSSSPKTAVLENSF